MGLPSLDCAGCRKCCLGDTITLLPGDDPAAYKTKLIDGKRQLAKGRDGNCVYLGKSGCQIHGRAPYMCRRFDCRQYFLDAERLGEAAVQARLAKPCFVEGKRRVELLRQQNPGVGL